MRFQTILRQQLEILWRACRSFDRGHESEAISMAGSLRVIFHSSNRSTSLLRHLNAENIHLQSSCEPNGAPTNAIVYEGGLTFVGGQKSGWKAKLDRANLTLVTYQEWWNTEIVSVYERVRYSRRTIILDTANKVGGAHVDEIVPRHLELLIDGPWEPISFGGASAGAQRRNEDLHFQYIRQIAYEVIHSKQILELVAADYQLQSDLQFHSELNTTKQNAISNADQLYQSALRLADSSSKQETPLLVESALAVLSPYVDLDTALLFARILWLKGALIYKSDRASALACYEKIRDTFLEIFRGTGIPRDAFAIFVKANFEIGLLSILLNDRAKSEAALQTVIDLTLTYLNDVAELSFDAKAEPISYLLTGINNLAVHALNSQEFEKVLRVFGQNEPQVQKLCPGLLDKWNIAEINQNFGPPHGDHIAQHVSKYLRNKAFALLALKQADDARVCLDNLQSRFSSTSDVKVLQRISDVKTALALVRPAPIKGAT